MMGSSCAWEGSGVQRMCALYGSRAGPGASLKRAAAARLDWGSGVGRQVQCGCVLVHRGCRLSAAVADGAAEIQGGYSVLAQRALESCTAVQRFGCVISHFSIIVPPL